MAEESSFNDLDYGLDSRNAVLSDNNMDNNIDEGDVSYSKIPDDFTATNRNVDNISHIDYKKLKLDIEEAGKEFGVMVTEDMENYILATSSAYDPSGDSFMWFMAAVSYQNNTRIIPEMVSMIEDLRSEIKSLQSVNRSLTVTSADIVKKMTSVKDDVLAGFEGLRRSVLDKIVAIPAQVGEVFNKVVIEEKPNISDKGIPKSAKPIPSASKELKWVEKATSVQPSVTNDLAQKAVTPKAGTAAKKARISCLNKLEVNPALIKNMSESTLEQIIPADELMILIEKWDDDESDAIKDEVEMRVIMLENELLN